MFLLYVKCVASKLNFVLVMISLPSLNVNIKCLSLFLSHYKVSFKKIIKKLLLMALDSSRSLLLLTKNTHTLAICSSCFPRYSISLDGAWTTIFVWWASKTCEAYRLRLTCCEKDCLTKSQSRSRAFNYYFDWLSSPKIWIKMKSIGFRPKNFLMIHFNPNFRGLT